MTTTGITLVNTATNAVTATLSTLAPTYNSATGVATWNFDAGVPRSYAIPPGQTLQRGLSGQGRQHGLGAGMQPEQPGAGPAYYSFDSQDVPVASYLDKFTLATSTATVQLTTAAATALSKQALVTNAAIGQPFTYSITVPAVPQPTAMYDVRILDNLSSSVTGVDMSLVSVQRVSGPSFTPVNTGTATNLVIQDTTNGIDIPARRADRRQCYGGAQQCRRPTPWENSSRTPRPTPTTASITARARRLTALRVPAARSPSSAPL